MSEEKLLTIRDVATILGISEKEVIELSESGMIPAYKIAGVYLRFKRQQIDEFKKKNRALAQKEQERKKSSLRDRISDFFYFNDFYIAAVLIIILIMVVIFQGY